MKTKTLDIIVDTREQTPLHFPEHNVIRHKLDTGDYSLEGYEDVICVERKSIGDLISTLNKVKSKGKKSNRERFWEELERMTSFRTCAIIIEGKETDVMPHCTKIYTLQWKQYMARKKRNPRARKPLRPEVRALGVFGSLRAIRADFGVHYYFLGDAHDAGEWVEEYFQYFMRHKD